MIERTFGVHSHRDHVGRLLCEAGWSRKPLIEWATLRDEAAGAHLGPTRADADSVGPAHRRSSVSDSSIPLDGWATLHASASGLLRYGGGRRLPARPIAQDPGHLEWGSIHSGK